MLNMWQRACARPESLASFSVARTLLRWSLPPSNRTCEILDGEIVQEWLNCCIQLLPEYALP